MTHAKRKTNQRNKSSRQRRESNGFFYCYCPQERNELRRGIIAHAARDHKGEVYSTCNHEWCIFPLYTEAKSDHICWSNDDVIAAGKSNDPRSCRGKKKAGGRAGGQAVH